MSIFDRYIGIDYSGAGTAESSQKGIRVYSCVAGGLPVEIEPARSAKKYWSRAGVAEWIIQQLSGDDRIIVGIDHGFAFPVAYSEKYKLPADWDFFLDDFVQHWPTDESNTYVDFVRFGNVGNGAARTGSAKWRRECEKLVGGKSVFHFDVQGSVAKSTHSGLPWLRHIRRSLGQKLHFWPFDGWQVPENKSVIAEVYPALWNHKYPLNDRTSDQQDAYVTAAAMADADLTGALKEWFCRDITENTPTVGQVEGWILGVMTNPIDKTDQQKLNSAESRLLTKAHLLRESNRELVNKKKQDVLKRTGVLACEACGFDFQQMYGDRGEGFAEVHHIKPPQTLIAVSKTHINDLAIVCANCHRMIHRRKPWLDIDDLKAIISK